MLPKNLPLPQMQTKWASEIDPILGNLLLQGQMLSNITLSNGITIINHKLQRTLIGWFLVGVSGAATVYDNQASNQTPSTTLSLTSNAAVKVNLWVF